MRELGLALAALGLFAAGFLWGGGFERERQETRVLVLQAVADSLNAELNDCQMSIGDYAIHPDSLFYQGLIR